MCPVGALRVQTETVQADRVQADRLRHKGAPLLLLHNTMSNIKPSKAAMAVFTGMKKQNTHFWLIFEIVKKTAPTVDVAGDFCGADDETSARGADEGQRTKGGWQGQLGNACSHTW